MCYKTGQVYLLLTGESGFPNYRKLNVTHGWVKKEKTDFYRRMGFFKIFRAQLEERT